MYFETICNYCCCDLICNSFCHLSNMYKSNYRKEVYHNQILVVVARMLIQEK